jgi:hypothetical protein
LATIINNYIYLNWRKAIMMSSYRNKGEKHLPEVEVGHYDGQIPEVEVGQYDGHLGSHLKLR